MIVIAKVDLYWQDATNIPFDSLGACSTEWNLEGTGPRLASTPWTGDDFYEIVLDLKALQSIGARGNIYFVDTESEQPFVKAVLASNHLRWYATAWLEGKRVLDATPTGSTLIAVRIKKKG